MPTNCERTGPSRGLPLNTMVVLLCIVSGGLDAISFLAWGDAFASVMTGNVVILGVATGTLDSELALFSGFAILGYAIGVITGSRLVRRWCREAEPEVWPLRVTQVLGVELVVITALGTVWAWTDAAPGRWAVLALLAVAAWSMGMQGAAIRAIGVPVSTTYMTGALTTLLEAAVFRRPYSATETSAMGGLLALLVGALLGSLTLHFLPRTAVVVPTLALGTVVALGYRWHRRGVSLPV